MEKTRIAAVVVTFNRKKLLLECLNSLKNQTHQLDAIFIIDGPSTDGTQDILLNSGYIIHLPPNNYYECSWEVENIIHSPGKGKILISYVRLYNNVGGSGGFHEGVKRAHEKGYDWIWLMDDDAEPSENALEELIKYIDLPEAIALAPVVKDSNGQISIFSRGYIFPDNIFQTPLSEETYYQDGPISIDFISFVGPLICIEAGKFIGNPRKEFFIYFDDFDYSIRLRKAGKIYLIPTSTIIHKEKRGGSNLIKKRLFGKDFYIDRYNNYWKTYYLKRNGTYLGKTYYRNESLFLLHLIKWYILSLAWIVLIEDHKFRKIWFTTSAYLDGLRNIFDNEKPKKILYGDKEN